MKTVQSIALLILLSMFSLQANAQVNIYAWDSNLGLVIYDEAGTKTDLPGDPSYNICLAINPVNGEMWGYNQSTLYSIDRTDGSFTEEATGGASYGEACSFDNSGTFFITVSTTLYSVDLVTGAQTLVKTIPINPDGFDILPDGRWVAADSGTIYVLDSDWNVQSQWSGGADETISADETGRVFGIDGNNVYEIDIVNQTETLLFSDPAAVQLYGSEATSGGVPVTAETEPVPALNLWSTLLLAGLLFLFAYFGLRRQRI